MIHKFFRWLVAAFILIAFASAALALWIVGAEAAEKPAAFNGSAFTVVAPLFDGTSGNTSYLRLANVSLSPVTFSVSVVGTPTGKDYGTAQYSVPPLSSPQYSYGEILARVGATVPTGADDSFSFYLRTDADFTGFQHVIYNPGNGFFENVSICTFDAAHVYSGLNQAVGNVHTTLLAAYPSQVVIHHYGSAPARYHAAVYDGRTGAFKGAFNFDMAANETYVAPMSWYQSNAGWTPSGAEYHANIFFSRDDNGTYQAIVGQAIVNDVLHSVVNMTQFCGINH